MHGCRPWGGFGANPLCRFLDRTNMGSGYLYNGGYPYSEGIFEDINKYIMLSYYSGETLISHDAVRRYAKFEFCCDDTALVDAIERSETGLTRGTDHKSWRFQISDTSDVEYVYETLSAYDRKLPENIRTTKKWRMMYLRAVIDHELIGCDFDPTRSDRCVEAMNELRAIYHTNHDTLRCVCPPTVKL